MDKQEKLNSLKLTLSGCTGCPLKCNSAALVFGSGNPDAEVMFIGEAPGKKETETGIPFVGSSGKILDKMLASINLKRDDVYLTNILKCRPPENRDPLAEEITACIPLLEKQIAIINPKIIITLGRFALNCFLPDAKISQVHGKIFEVSIGETAVKLFPIHHPAAARQNRKTRALFEEDFRKIPTFL